MSNLPICPVCEGDLDPVMIPKHDIHVCGNPNCEELVQRNKDGTLSPLGSVLERGALGDDRVRGVISAPHVSTVQSFVEIYDNATRSLQLDLATASGGLRTLLAQIENRLDFCLQRFTGLDMVDEEAEEGLRALREARELVSTQPRSQRGVSDD